MERRTLSCGRRSDGPPRCHQPPVASSVLSATVAIASNEIWAVGFDGRATSSEELIAGYGLDPKGMWEPFRIVLLVP
jgi:hypothetical protein